MRAVVSFLFLSAVVYAQGVIPISPLQPTPTLQGYLKLTEEQMPPQRDRRNDGRRHDL